MSYLLEGPCVHTPLFIDTSNCYVAFHVRYRNTASARAASVRNGLFSSLPEKTLAVDENFPLVFTESGTQKHRWRSTRI